MIFQSIKTSRLKKDQISQIIKLKNTYWDYGKNSQIKWFNKNAYPNDLHNLVLIKRKIIGYTFLGKRFYLTKNNKKRYILFSSLILNKKYRKFKYASKFMNFNSKVIKKRKIISFLYCDKNKVKFYKYFGWITLNKSMFKVPDHKSKQIGMVFNLKKSKTFLNTSLKFYYHL